MIHENFENSRGDFPANLVMMYWEKLATALKSVD